MLGALAAAVLIGGCSHLATSPAPPGLRAVVVLPVDNHTGSPLDAEPPALPALQGWAAARVPITAADLLTLALRTALEQRGFTATIAGSGRGGQPFASLEEPARLGARDAAALCTELRVWESTSLSHLVYVNVALDARLVTADGRTLWSARLPATPIDGGGASSTSLGYPEVARRVADLVTSDLRPARHP